MEEEANVQLPTSNVQLRTEENSHVFPSTLNVHPLLQLLIVFLAGLLIYGYRLGDSPLDRTEPFRALVAHQMVTSGDWLIPRLYGEVYLRKPPLIYWIEAGTEKLMGRGDEFVWRLPSAVGSAALAVFLAWWAGRWFGSVARLPAGFACLALIALWDQNRGADIDALNTVAAVITTVCVLELLCGLGRWTAAWSVGLGISLGATLLLKGPGGLPQVVGALIGPAIVLGDWKALRRPSIWIGVLIGFAIFATYIVIAKSAMHRAGIVPDHSGTQEVVEKIFLHSWRQRFAAILTPALLVVFALPVSLVLPFAIAGGADQKGQRAKAILGTLAATAVIWIFGSNDNPRYEYVMLPLLAPLVGYVWAGEWDLPRMLVPVGVMLSGGYLLLAGKLNQPFVWGAGGVSLLVCGGWVVGMARGKALAAKAASPVIVLLMLLFAVPMAERKNAERRRKSAANPAVVLRKVIGNATRVSAAGVVRDLPELFYYAGVDVHSYGEFGLPQLAAVRGGHWVVISENEKYPAYSTIKKDIPGAFPRGITKLPMPDPRDQIYVGWYDPPANADTRLEWHVEKSVEPED